MVLAYHRVLPKDALRRQSVQAGMYVLDRVFDQHMIFLKRNFTVLSFQQLLDLWKKDQWNAQDRYCVITFDDGWLDNYHHAYPILKRHDIPATIFLPIDFVGTHEWFWPDQVACLLNGVKESHARREDGKEIKLLLARHLKKETCAMVQVDLRQESGIDQIIEQCKDLPIGQIRELITALAAVRRVSLPQDRVIVNWEEVREMSQHGISFGSHSCSHRILTTIRSEDVSQELVESRRVLMAQKVNYVPVFCYPNGNSDPYIQRQVQICGYEAAVSVQAGVEGRTPENQYAIRRVGIHNDVTSTLPLFSFRLFGPLPGSA